MIVLNIFLVLCWGSRLGHGVGLHGFHYRGLEEPTGSAKAIFETVTEGWIEQPLDHFNPRENRTWKMRYYENSGHFKNGGPIFIMIGGEWTISTGFLKSGLMFDLASTYSGAMYYTEHRYYGKSKPTEDIEASSLQYLSVDQALADLAYFIETKKNRDGFRNSTVVVFGGSYAGNVAAWLRLKYPHLVQAAVASSAPVFAKLDFNEYYEVVTDSLRKHSQECVDEIKAAFDAVEELLKLEDGSRRLKKYFNLCHVPDVDSLSDVSHFMNFLSEKFAGIVQYDKIDDRTNRTKIAEACDKMTASYLGSPLQRLAHLMGREGRCFDNSYAKFVERYRNATWSPDLDMTRQWVYQTCTEYGYYQTTDSKGSVFGSLPSLRYFTDMCVDLYGEYYDNEFLNARVKRTNIMYGGIRPDLRNVIFTNGDLDPWHALSVLRDLNPRSPAILIKGSSHCRDMYEDLDSDGRDLIEARARVREIVGSWIGSA